MRQEEQVSYDGCFERFFTQKNNYITWFFTSTLCTDVVKIRNRRVRVKNSEMDSIMAEYTSYFHTLLNRLSQIVA